MISDKFLNPLDEKRRSSFSPWTIVLMAASVAALIGTYGLSRMDISLQAQALAFGGILAAYLSLCFGSLFLWDGSSLGFGPATDRLDAIEKGLASLEDANEYFGGSLRTEDAFRLAASRINSMVPHDVCLLVVAAHDGRSATITHAEGTGSTELEGRRVEVTLGLPALAIAQGRVVSEGSVTYENAGFKFDPARHFQSMAALPLMRDGRAFGSVVLLSTAKLLASEAYLETFEAIAERVSGLVNSSLSFESNMANALKDPITDMPNERAFFVVLENQIAESSRRPEERPLSMLAIDIKNFDEINYTYGHVIGDKVLSFAGETIRAQLRQMDMIARTTNDEFLVLLPTADNVVAREIAGRIADSFHDTSVAIDAVESVVIDLYFGVSSFMRDGDEANKMISAARFAKSRAKSPFPNKVAPFAKDLYA